MFKKVFLSLVLIVGLGFQCNLKANNILNSDIQQISLESLGEQELEVLERVIEQSPEIQELLEGKDKAISGEILICIFEDENCQRLFSAYPAFAALSLVSLLVGSVFGCWYMSKKKDIKSN